MSILLAVVGSFGELPSITISAGWENLSMPYPTFSDSNSDRTLSWTGGAGTRLISIEDTGFFSIEYRINSGSWTSYISGPFSINSGDTVAWQAQVTGVDNSQLAVVKDATKNETIDSFTITESGNP